MIPSLHRATGAAVGSPRMVLLLVSVGTLSLAVLSHAQTTRSDRQIYESACAACHGSDGRGTPSNATDYPIPRPDLTDCNWSTREPTIDWLAVAHTGGPARAFNRLMPAFGEALSRTDLDLAVAHARSFCTSDAWPRGDLNLPRALVTTKAFPEDEAVLTVVADGSAVNNKFVYERRIGAVDQFELIVPLAFSERAPNDWTGGVGDIALAFKHVLGYSLSNGSIVSAAAELVLPTGSTERGIGGGTTAIEPFFAYGQRLPGGVFLQMQGGGSVPFNREHNDEAFLRTAIGQQFRTGGLGRLWAPMVEFIGTRELGSGAGTNWDVLPQLHVTLSTRQHIRGNFGVRIPMNQREGRSTQYLGFFLWEWFGGGLFTGW